MAELRTDAWTPVAALPDGHSWLTRIGREGWRVHGRQTSPGVDDGWGRAIGVEPGGRAAWTGGRCWFQWRVPTPDGPAWWTPSNHGWPDGHAKKLYGFQDNDPLWVHVAPDGSACLSVYEHDALLTPGLPLRWRDVGGGVAVAERASRAEPRALFFERADGDQGFPGDPSTGDEDARDAFATVCLGPSPGRRYTVGRSRPTWRLRGEHGVRLGGPGGGWAVFDEDHAEVLSGPEELLAGVDRWLLLAADDGLIRLDLVTEARATIGPAGRPITFALAVPATPNILLVSADTDERWWLRLV